MLAHSPPLPLVLDYDTRGRGITTDDEEGISLALKQRDRVLRVRLDTSLQRIITAMDEEYPILEYLVIKLPVEDKSTILILPETLRAPQLRHLKLRGFAIPVGSRLLTTAVGLITLYLSPDHLSTYFHPNNLLQWISLMPKLEMLVFFSKSIIPSRDVESQLTHSPVTAPPVTHPNLHHFQFRGVSAYLEALVHRIAAPRLKKLDIDLFSQPTISVPRLLQFINATENLGYDSVVFRFFEDYVSVAIYPRGADVYALGILLDCLHLAQQVSFMIQISSSLSRMFSTVEHLTFQHKEHIQSSEEHNQVDRTEWRRLLGPFINVRNLGIDNGLVEDLSRCLKLEDGELLSELLPELQELSYSRSGDTGDAFTSYINARRNAGRPVALVTWS